MSNDTGPVGAGPGAQSDGMTERVTEILHELALIVAAQSEGLGRIEALERDAAALRASLAEEVVTRRVRVLDDDGRERVRIDKAIKLVDEGGVERISLHTGTESGSICLFTLDPKTFASWSAGEDLHSAEIGLGIYTRDEEAVSFGVDAGELAPGKPGIDPACRVRGLDGPYVWGACRRPPDRGAGVDGPGGCRGR